MSSHTDNQVRPRPVTSKARGPCKYYDSPRGCFAGNYCKFLHVTESPRKPLADSDSGDPILTPYDRSKRCRYFAQGYCKRGDKCWFLHALVTVETPSTKQSTPLDREDEDVHCSICFERPSTFGLLTDCSHIFCLSCIRQWRSHPPDKFMIEDMDNTKKCPMCRTNSRYVVPSSIFCKEGPEKKAVITKYRESTRKVPCKYFELSKSRSKRPACPFGRKCFYRHLNDDGTPHEFKEAVSASRRAYTRLSRLQSEFSTGTSRGHYPQNEGISTSNSANHRIDLFSEEFLERAEAPLIVDDGSFVGDLMDVLRLDTGRDYGPWPTPDGLDEIPALEDADIDVGYLSNLFDPWDYNADMFGGEDDDRENMDMDWLT